MCGRYAITLPPERLRSVFGYREQPNFPPRYNIAPTQPVPVVHLDQGERHFTLMRWGFLPGWVKDPKDFPLVINVRSESAAEKPSFRAALIRRRALMPADAFYEWRSGEARGAQKLPYLFRRPDREPFAFAALWETWHSPDGSEIDTAALVSGSANGLMSAIHHRCPVVLDPKDYDAWLDPAADAGTVAKLMRPPPDAMLEMIPIGPAVNKVAHDGPECQAPREAMPVAKAEEPAQGSLF